jgi:hypothetical protein
MKAIWNGEILAQSDDTVGGTARIGRRSGRVSRWQIVRAPRPLRQDRRVSVPRR